MDKATKSILISTKSSKCSFYLILMAVTDFLKKRGGGQEDLHFQLFLRWKKIKKKSKPFTCEHMHILVVFPIKRRKIHVNC